MSTTAVTPDAGAGAGSSSPAAGTSSSPATSTPSTPVTSSDPQPGQSNTDFIRQQLEKVDVSGVEKPEVKPEVTEAPVVEKVEDPNAHPATEKTPEEIQAEADRVAAEKAAADEANQPNPLDKLGTLPAEKVAEALKDPAFAEMCKAKGIDPDTMLQTARDAAETEQYREIVGSPETAKYVKQGAEHFFTLDDEFPKIQPTADSVGTFLMDHVLPLTYLTDEQGQPLKNADGTFKTDGSMTRLIAGVGDMTLGMAADIVGKLPQDNDKVSDMGIAIKMVSDFIKNGYAIEPPAELPPEVKAAKEEVARREKELNQRETDQKTTARNAFAEKAWTDATKGTDSLIGAVVKPSGLSEPLQARASDEIYGKLAEKIAGDKTYQRQKADILARGLNEASQKELVALHKTTLQRYFKRTANEVMGIYGGKVVSDSAARNDKINTQLNTDRMNQAAATTAGTTATSGALSSDAAYTQAEQEILAENGGKRPADYQSKMIGKLVAIRAKQAHIA